MSTITPPINTKGSFELKAPFDNILNIGQEYTVVAVRTINDLVDGGEDPLNSIYVKVSLTETDLLADIANEIVIVTLMSNGGKYIYVPNNRIATMPMPIGVRYQERVLAIPLGAIPVVMDLTTVKDDLKNLVYDKIGITTTVDEVDASAISLVSDIDHATFTQLLAAKKTITKSDRTRYLETLELYTKLQASYTELECYIKNVVSPVAP